MHTLKGPPAPTPQPTGSTTHHLPTLIHPQSYNTHKLKGPPTLLPPTHRKYHPPSYNTSTLKGPPAPHPYPQPTGSTTHHLTTLIHPQSCNTHTLKGPTASHPVPPTHREYHPHSNNTHTLKRPPYPHPTGSTTHNLTKLMN